jgi:hypothetical protein
MLPAGRIQASLYTPIPWIGKNELARVARAAKGGRK